MNFNTPHKERVLELLKQEELKIDLVVGEKGKKEIRLSVENVILYLHNYEETRCKRVILYFWMQENFGEKKILAVGHILIGKKVLRVYTERESEEKRFFEEEKKIKRQLERIITVLEYFEEEKAWKYNQNEDNRGKIDNKQKEVIRTTFIRMMLECVKKNKEIKNHYREWYRGNKTKIPEYKTIEKAILLEKRKLRDLRIQKVFKPNKKYRREIKETKKEMEELVGKIRVSKFGVIEERSVLCKQIWRVQEKIYDENSIKKSGYFLENLLSEIEDEKEIMSDQEKFATLLRFMLLSEELKMNRATESYSLAGIKEQIIGKFHLKESKKNCCKNY